jgi:predicted porin
MKKSLFAIAAVTAFAGAAQAQSSVTVYGLLDVGYIGSNSRVSSNAITKNGGQYKTTTNQIGDSAESTSRLGFKGTEDLGSGMSAFFTAEFALAPTDQNLGGNGNAGLQNRQAFVGVKKNGLGQTALGNQYTPVFNSVASTSANQMNNMIGDMIYPTGKQGAANGGTGYTTAGFTARTGNTLTINSDSFGGFRAGAMYTLNGKNDSQSTTSAGATIGGTTNSTGWGLNADYTYSKFYISAAYQALKQVTTASQVAPTFTENANTGAVTVANSALWANAQGAGAASTIQATTGNALNIQDNQFYAGASYDFGILKAYAQYINRKGTSTASSNYYVKRQAEQIGVRSFITPKVEAWASAGLGRYTTFGANQPTANMNGWQLGSNYWLSKRTNLYAIYGQTIVSNSAGATTTTSGSANNYAMGVRHTF